MDDEGLDIIIRLHKTCLRIIVKFTEMEKPMVQEFMRQPKKVSRDRFCIAISILYL